MSLYFQRTHWSFISPKTNHPEIGLCFWVSSSTFIFMSEKGDVWSVVLLLSMCLSGMSACPVGEEWDFAKVQFLELFLFTLMAKNTRRKPCKKTEAVHLWRPQPVKAAGTFTQMLEEVLCRGHAVREGITDSSLFTAQQHLESISLSPTCIHSDLCKLPCLRFSWLTKGDNLHYQLYRELCDRRVMQAVE